MPIYKRIQLEKKELRYTQQSGEVFGEFIIKKDGKPITGIQKGFEILIMVSEKGKTKGVRSLGITDSTAVLGPILKTEDYGVQLPTSGEPVFKFYFKKLEQLKDPVLTLQIKDKGTSTLQKFTILKK